MHGATSLLDFILNLLKDPQAQAEFRASPEQVLSTNCLTGVCAADIHETLPLVTDHRSVELIGTGHSAPPPMVLAGDTGIHGAIHYLHYITGAYRYDDHGTTGHEPGHENIWAVGDVGHDFDGVHQGLDPSAPGYDQDRSSHWTGDGHGNAPSQGAQIYGDHSGQIYGDHTGRIYGDHTSGDDHGLASSSPDGRVPGPSGDGHLHSFGSGAATPVTSSTNGLWGQPGETGNWHDGPGSGIAADPEHPTSTTDTTDADDTSHSPEVHGGLGGSYDDQGGEHDFGDDHGWYLDLH